MLPQKITVLGQLLPRKHRLLASRNRDVLIINHIPCYQNHPESIQIGRGIIAASLL
ncbi:hypothetical protein DP20_3379 [Shigella flexneri]|nr:hypothetical protein DP20_3379 [Shigella flexneri]